MRTKLGCLFGLMMVASVGGCGGGDSSAPKNTCSASLTAGMSDYTLSGASIVLGDAPNSVTLTRISAGATSDLPIYGVWQLPVSAEDGLTADGQIDFENGSVTLTTLCSALGDSKTATIKVTSAATITETSVTILQSQSNTAVF